MRLLKKILDSVAYKIASKSSDLNPVLTEDAVPAQLEFIYKNPINLDNLPYKTRVNFKELLSEDTNLPMRHLFIYENALITNEGVVFSRFRVAPLSLTFIGRVKDYYDSFFLKEWFSKRVVISQKETVVIIHNSNSTANYYHWLIEACSRLLSLDGKFKDAYLVVPQPIASYVSETTKLLGYTRLLPIANNTVLKATKIILTERTSTIKDNSYNAYATHQDPELIRSLRKKLLGALNFRQVKPFRLLYISRAKQKSRRLTNEEEVTNLLLKRGFEIVFFETLSFTQQVILMNEAAVVIGVHGANLSNILFMQPGQVVIELMNDMDFNSVYFRLASYGCLPYYRLLCKPQIGIPVEQADVTLNYQELDVILNQVLLK